MIYDISYLIYPILIALKNDRAPERPQRSTAYLQLWTVFVQYQQLEKHTAAADVLLLLTWCMYHIYAALEIKLLLLLLLSWYYVPAK